MKFRWVLYVGGLISIFSGSTAQAQQDSTAVEIKQDKPYYYAKKNDGQEYYGYLINDDGREILLETESIGKVYLLKSELSALKQVDKDHAGSAEVPFEHGHSGVFTTRYAFTTNAMPVKKGEHYAMLHLYGPELHFSVTDNVSLGVMTTWIGAPLALASKFSLYSNEKTSVALGTIMGWSSYLGQGQNYGGLHWLTMTHGSRAANFSLSAGYGYLGGLESYDVGRKYFYQSYDPTADYYVNPNADFAISEGGYPSYEYLQGRSLITGLVFGFGGIVPVGNKSSFIFDSMILFGGRDNVTYTDKTITTTYESDWDWETGEPTMTTEDFVIGVGELDPGTLQNIDGFVAILMPSFRINNTDKKAIQITLSGIIYQNRDYQTGATEVRSFPAPFVTWLRQF